MRYVALLSMTQERAVCAEQHKTVVIMRRVVNNNRRISKFMIASYEIAVISFGVNCYITPDQCALIYSDFRKKDTFFVSAEKRYYNFLLPKCPPRYGEALTVVLDD